MFQKALMSCAVLLVSNESFAATKEMPEKDNIVFYTSFENGRKPEINKTISAIKWHGRTNIVLKEGVGEKGAMMFNLEGYAEIDKSVVNVKSGTIAFWFKPVGDPTGDTHTYLSWGWNTKKYASMVFSQPWFEGDASAGGPNKTYYVFLNQIRSVTAFMTNINIGEWTFYAITWEILPNRKIRLLAFQNGKEVASQISSEPLPEFKSLMLSTPVYLGTDKGVLKSKGRWLDGYVNDFIVYDKALDAEEIKKLFLFRASNPKLKICDTSSWMKEIVGKPYNEKRDKDGKLLESRVLFGEAALLHYMSKEKIKKELKRIRNAGFNVYTPMVWRGHGIQCKSETVKKSKCYLKLIEGSDKDPYKTLLEESHKLGVEVHSCFMVMVGRYSPYPEFVVSGTKWHNGYAPQFRDFVVKMVLEHVEKYKPDGINLDYIRIQAGLDSPAAQKEYRRIYGRNLTDDRTDSKRMAEFAGYCVNDIVQRISNGAKKIKPDIVVSVCVSLVPKSWGLPANGRNSELWVKKGWIDVSYNMDYGQKLSVKMMDETRKDNSKPYAFVELLGNYDYVKGKCIPRNPKLLAKLVDFCRRKYNDGNGIALYFYKILSNEQIEELRKGPFKELAKPSWKKQERNN